MSVFALLSAGLCLGQSLGDIARQERERRSKLPQHAAVITNEDLNKDKIFPAPPEPVAAGNAVDPAPQATAPAAGVPLWSVAEQPEFSLGEYARKLREQRLEREQQAELASKPHAGPAAISQQKQSPRQPGASASKAEAFPATPQRRGPAGQRLIRVERGDSLWKLARRHYGHGRLWKLLWKANPEIRRPNLLSVGQVLRQPSDTLLALRHEHRTTLQVEAAHFNRGAHIQAQQHLRPRATMADGSADAKLMAAPTRPQPVLAPLSR